MNKHGNGNLLYNLLAVVFRFLMRNLEFIPLCFALQFWFDAGNSWKYWVTIILVAIASGISIAWHKDNNR
jgi:hypothetical protein